MNILQAIYTEKNNCQDCYKCVRRCPVKAIKIEGHRASVMDDLCIYCGKCVQVCPAGAKKVRNDIAEVKYLLGRKQKLILSLAPSWVVGFSDYSVPQLQQAIESLGFYGLSETAIGAEWVASDALKLIQSEKEKLWISSCCPVVVQLIKKYYPQYLNHITPLLSPMQAHARYLKTIYGSDCLVVFAGPCIAKKTELLADDNAVEVAITFDELRSWLDDEALTPEFLNGKNNESTYAHNRPGSIYPVDGGMISVMRQNATITDAQMMTFSGLINIRNILDQLPQLHGHSLFLELMACEGGCINGPGMKQGENTASKRLNVLEHGHSLPGHHDVKFPADSICHNFCESSIQKPIEHSEADIKHMLSSIDKLSREDELNCSGCGYESCRDFACAMLEGKAERQMCVSYMRKVAQNKASVLLQKIPYGVVMADEHMHIIESNESFAQILGADAIAIYKARPGMQGTDLNKLMPFSKLFKGLLQSGEESIDKDIRYNNQLVHLSVFSIQKHKIVCGIIHPLSRQGGLSHEMQKRLHQAMYENMMTAQKAAALLGENASKTEFLLHSVLDASQNSEPDHE